MDLSDARRRLIGNAGNHLSPIQAPPIPTAIPTMVSITRRIGCLHACCGLMAATTITTVMVMLAVMTSSDRPTKSSTIAPIAMSTTKPQTRNEKTRR